MGTLSERKHHRSLTNRDPHGDPQQNLGQVEANTVQFPLASHTAKKLAGQNSSVLSGNTKNLVEKIRQSRGSKESGFEVPATSFEGVDTKARLDLTKKKCVDGELGRIRNESFLCPTVKKNSGKLSAKTKGLIRKIQENKMAQAGEQTVIDQLESNKVTSKKIVEESTVIADNTISKVNEILNLPSAKDRYAELVAPGKILVLPVEFNR
jgi:hypothetical protein